MIEGKILKLSSGATVWMSNDLIKDKNGTDMRAINLTHANGTETRIGLSDEALCALTNLHKQPLAISKFNYRVGEWRMVEPTSVSDRGAE